MEDVLGADRVREVVSTMWRGHGVLPEKVPCSFFFCRPPSATSGLPHHHPKFDVNEEVLWIGAAVMAHFALTWQEGKSA